MLVRAPAGTGSGIIVYCFQMHNKIPGTGRGTAGRAGAALHGPGYRDRRRPRPVTRMSRGREKRQKVVETSQIKEILLRMGFRKREQGWG